MIMMALQVEEAHVLAMAATQLEAARLRATLQVLPKR
jgi:hypothetical protein